MAIGLGASGLVGVAKETTRGTYQAPTVYVPFLEEGLTYTEDKYFSEAIQKQVVDADVAAGFYHAAGPLNMEFDSQFAPYFLDASRHVRVKTGASSPFTYTYTPSSGASGVGASPATLSITIERNGVLFGYPGCIVDTLEFTVDAGVLRMNMGIMGVGEQDVTGPLTPTFPSRKILGADAHEIRLDAAGTAPTFASGTIQTNFDGITMSFNHNSSAENRINRSRAASYIAFHKTEFSATTSLDFESKTEYTNFRTNVARALQLESIGAVPASDAIRIRMFRAVLETYDVTLGGMGDITKAGATFHGLNQPGGSPYEIRVLSTSDVA